MIRNAIQRFMYGRYGNDQLNVGLMVLYLVLYLLYWLTSADLLYWVSMVVLFTALFRLLSRSHAKRRAENANDQLGQPQHQRLPNADEGRPLRYRHKGGLHLHRLENVALFVGSGGGFGPCDPEYDRLE